MASNITQIIHELLPLLRQFCLDGYGVALGGAHAKGVADDESDLDIYLFTRKIEPAGARTRLLQQFSGSATEIYSWDIDGEFNQAGTDFTFRDHRVECWLRNSDDISQTVTDCQAGIVRRDLVTWTVMGFFNHCVLSDLQHMIVIEDPAGLLAHWQDQVGIYPPKLQQTIIADHLNAAKFWPENFHYASAVERQDIIYIMGIVQQVVFNLIQVIFALNQSYFPGEKKVAAALSQLALVPDRFTERIQALISPEQMVDKSFLLEQRREMQALTREVESLVAG